MLKRATLIIGLVTALTACTPPYELVKVGPHKVNGVYAIDTPVEWSQANIIPFKPWTIDGDNLQALMLIGGVEDGEAIFGKLGAEKADPPTYDAAMREIDIAELVEASFEFIGMNDFSVSNLRPAPFDKLQGFRFDYDFVSGSGLTYRGDAFGAVDEEGRLNLILYSGTRLHYFEKHHDDVEKIFSSVKLL